MKIDFYLRFHTILGQQLSIVGNISALGENITEDALPMKFFSNEFWHASLDINEKDFPHLHYQYILKDDLEIKKEAEKSRIISFEKKGFNDIILIDTWNDSSVYENVFFTTPFQKVLLPRKKNVSQKKVSSPTHWFKVKAPLLSLNEIVCLLGSSKALQNWNVQNPLLLEQQGEWWVAKTDLSKTEFPIRYKYGIYDIKKKQFVRYEQGEDRVLHNNAPDALTILHDGFLLVTNTWKGAGVAIPVFSLRTKNSFGVGEFVDIKLLVDWAVQSGLRLLQFLPVNDTSATFTSSDSYPYACISAFALHPLYVNLQKVAGKKYAAAIRSINKKQRQLNSLIHLDYEKVMQFKTGILRELYDLQFEEFLQNKDYLQFFKSNEHWLIPYAAFCFLRDKYNTSLFHTWKSNRTYNHLEIQKLTSSKSKNFKQIAFYYFIQFHLHLQLKEAAEYAHKKGVVLKGDIPIGIFRYGCDSWMNPGLYNTDQQAGAPPDDFAVKGQNWGFPTYNWQRMKEDNFRWWRQRFHQMSYYFDAFRIDHILGFFRIWSIPAHAVEGILGIFVPAIPIALSEFRERNIWFDYDRYCKPFITDAVLKKIFNSHAEFVKTTFLQPCDEGHFDLLEQYNTQKKVQEFFRGQDTTEENQLLKNGLFNLISNVILFEQPGFDKQQFHFRISVDSTSSFQHLDEQTKYKLRDLYIDYFYRRQDELWKREALGKLPQLKEATDMLVCGEDLGMVPHSVPHVMQQLAILSLEIQRMPKNQNTEFFHPKDAPYLSVITPSTHDMSTVRGWWEENRSKAQKFYNTVLEQQGEAPITCEAWINRAIVLQHLYSSAMWSIFQLQDILSMSEILRHKDPQEERINNPADPNHYWGYRMHLTLEDLIKEEQFNKELHDYIKNSGR